MKKIATEQWKDRYDGSKTAAYVVAHAKWQKSRGRRPSESYKGERNPLKALKLAREELKNYDPMAGEHLNYTVNHMIAVAQLTEYKVMATFNGVLFAVMPHSHPSFILAYIHRQFEKRAEEWRNSPEGLEFMRQQRENLKKMKMLHFDLMLELEELDFSDLTAVIDWMSRYQESSDHVGVETAWKEVAFKFFKNGYFPSVNCKEDFRENDKENSARWLIGQGLSCLRSKVHAIHQIFPHFAKEWNERFNPTPQPQAA